MTDLDNITDKKCLLRDKLVNFTYKIPKSVTEINIKIQNPNS